MAQIGDIKTASSFTGSDLFAALCVVLIWGTNFVAMKYGLRELTPFQLGAGRYLFAAIPLVLVVRPPTLPCKWTLLYGLLQGVGQFGLLFLALQVGLSAALASVLLQTQVFFTALFGFVVLGERPSRALMLGLLSAALGLACLAVGDLAPAHASLATLGGFALCLAAASMWAASNIVVRRAREATGRFDVVPFMVWSSLVPILPFIGLSLLFDPPHIAWPWRTASWYTWASLAYLGWMATIVGYALWAGLLKRHPVNRVAPFSLGVPVVGVSTGMLVLGDVISGWQWAGIALIVASLACVVLGGRVLGSKHGGR